MPSPRQVELTPASAANPHGLPALVWYCGRRILELRPDFCLGSADAPGSGGKFARMAKGSSSAETKSTSAGERPVEIELKDPWLAFLLAWLVPGLGHWYQGRKSKAVLFFVCILGTFVFGLYLGDGRVVYASWRPNDRRLHFLCHMGVGVPALTALVQANRRVPFEVPFFDRFMVPPQVNDGRDGNQPDELDDLHKRLHRYWELGTVYTMIAGLLNVLAIWDACAGPAFTEPRPAAKKKKQEEDPDKAPPEAKDDSGQ